MISAIAAIGKDRVIGRKGQLLWPIPDDLKRFKELTVGHPVIMGRKTYESIFEMRGKPLPGRPNIVITRSPGDFKDNPAYQFENVFLAASLDDGIRNAKEMDPDEVFICGGGQIYEQALPLTDRLYLTLIDDEKEGDAYFPAYESEFTKIISEEPREHEGLKYKWVTIER